MTDAAQPVASLTSAEVAGEACVDIGAGVVHTHDHGAFAETFIFVRDGVEGSDGGGAQMWEAAMSMSMRSGSSAYSNWVVRPLLGAKSVPVTV